MLGEREVILVGLGTLGTAISDKVKQLIEERSGGLGDKAHSVKIYYQNFTLGDVFTPNRYIKAFHELTKDSTSRKIGDRFTFIFVGDLYEDNVAKYAIDFAYLPYIMDQMATMFCSVVLGFFSFASDIGISENIKDINVSMVNGFFAKLEELNQTHEYKPPYKLAGGKDYQTVCLPRGPFDRNYIMSIPGSSKDVKTYASLLFSERIFYELYYLLDSFETKSRGWKSDIEDKENYDKCLCSFSMVQVPRISEVQKYYLKWSLETKVVESFLRANVKGLDYNYYLGQFLDMGHIKEEGDNFPIEYAAKVFIKSKVGIFQNILKSLYIKVSTDDITDYLSMYKGRIEDAMEKFNVYYEKFASEELKILCKSIISMLESLFKLDGLESNFPLCIEFIKELKGRLIEWKASLISFSQNTVIYDIDQDYARVGEKIKGYNGGILSFPLFYNIRQALIRYTLATIPMERYIVSRVRVGLSQAFLRQWDMLINGEGSPIAECDKYISDLEVLTKMLGDKKGYIEGKVDFIKGMNSSYYVLPMFTNKEEYIRLLTRIEERNFSSLKKDELEQTIKSAFKYSIKGKDIFSITKDPHGFITSVEEYVKDRHGRFCDVEVNAEQFERYSNNAIKNIEDMTHNINSNTFDALGDSLRENSFMLIPDIKQEDNLYDGIQNGFSKVDKETVPRNFTLGSIMYFKDYLFMPPRLLKKAAFLAEYDTIDLRTVCKYDSSLDDKGTTLKPKSKSKVVAVDYSNVHDHSKAVKAHKPPIENIESHTPTPPIAIPEKEEAIKESVSTKDTIKDSIKDSIEDSTKDTIESTTIYEPPTNEDIVKPSSPNSEVKPTTPKVATSNDGRSTRDINCTRMVLEDYMNKDAVVSLYNAAFGSTKTNVNNIEIEELAQTISLENALEGLNDDALFNFVRANNIPRKADRAKQIGLAVHIIRKG